MGPGGSNCTQVLPLDTMFFQIGWYDFESIPCDGSSFQRYANQLHNLHLPATFSRSVLGPTHPLIQSVSGLKRPDREAHHSEINNAWSFVSMPPICHDGPSRRHKVNHKPHQCVCIPLLSNHNWREIYYLLWRHKKRQSRSGKFLRKFNSGWWYHCARHRDGMNKQGKEILEWAWFRRRRKTEAHFQRSVVDTAATWRIQTSIPVFSGKGSTRIFKISFSCWFSGKDERANAKTVVGSNAQEHTAVTGKSLLK